MTNHVAAGVLCAIVGVAGASAQPVSLSRADYPNDVGARGIVAADFDGDGAVDFATANNNTGATVTIFLNRLATGGGFVRAHAYKMSAGPFGIAAGDFNGDGRLDLVVAAADADRIELLMGSAGGAFTRGTPISAPGNPRGIAVADVNGDGNPDVIYTSFLLDTVTVLFGDGAGSFPSLVVSPTGASPQDVVAGDFNGDGIVDLVVANTAAPTVTLLIGDGTGGFARMELPGAKNLHVLAVGDFDRDGWMDLAGASTSGNIVAIYLNRMGTGLKWVTTVSKGLSSPRGIDVADLNGDRLPELIVANRGSNAVTVFVASTAPTVYTSSVTVAAAAGSRAVAAADFDRDGRMDVAVGNDQVAAVSVFSNRATYPGVGAVAWELHALPPADPSFRDEDPIVSVADFNRNGIPDVVAGSVVVLDATTAVRVVIERQNQTYRSSVVGDFNGDGNPDFARMTEYGAALYSFDKNHGLDIFLGDGHGGFVFDRMIPVAGIPSPMVAGDLNGDGRTDIVFEDGAANSPTTRRVLLARADGAFTEIDADITGTRYMPPFGLADLNRDGHLDLFKVTDTAILVLLGDGAGQFPSSTTSPSAGFPYLGGPVIGDLNEDGIPDVVAGSGEAAVWLGRPDGTFANPIRILFGEGSIANVLADFTGDGHLDLLVSDGVLLEGRGDGTFLSIRRVNIQFTAAVAADMDRDGLVDLVLTGFDHDYAAMVLFNRKAPGPNLAPVADRFRDVTVTYSDQIIEDELELTASRSYDPNLDPMTYRWLDASGADVASSARLPICCRALGVYHFTLVVRDDHGAEARSTATLTIVPTQEIVLYASQGLLEGAWQQRLDSTAADGVASWHPNANAPKLAAPLADPMNFLAFDFVPDPSQEYKLWIRLKAEGNNWANDSVFVQFVGAVDGAGHSIYSVGTTSALAVNLEECTGCGDAGWGWRDDAWGAKGMVGSVLLRFSDMNGGRAGIWIQTREDGVMIDQIVLSSNKYKTTRPGAAKNDAVILRRTRF
jgi:FG-GAP-like repeat